MLEIQGGCRRRTWDFLVRHLAGEVPPENVRIKPGRELMKDKGLGQEPGSCRGRKCLRPLRFTSR